MRMLTPLNSNQKNNTFDVIRGMAVLFVLFAHLDNYILLYVWPISTGVIQYFLARIGYYLFFILSGYLIWASAQKLLNSRHSLTAFFTNRITRICPLYFFSITFIILMSSHFVGYKKPEIDFYIVFRHLLFSQSLSPNVSDALNGPYWTLTHEWIFYLLVPVIIYLKPTNFLIFCSIIICQVLWFMYPNYLNGFVHFWALFGTGIIIYQNQFIFTKKISISIIYAGLMMFFVEPKNTLYQMVFVIGLFNLLLHFEFKKALFLPLKGLGIISYSVYIWHAILIHLIAPYWTQNHLMIVPIKPWLPYGFYWESLYLILFILCFSTFSYWLIEKPCMKVLRIKLIEYLSPKV